MFVVDDQHDGELNDSDLINQAIERVHSEYGGGTIALSSRTYRIHRPLVLKSGVRIQGQGVCGTKLVAADSLHGPVVMSERLESLIEADAWFEREGVPVRFGLADLMIDGSEAGHLEGLGSGCGAYLYGKAFELKGVQISHAKSHGLVSVGSARSGQESWLDEPEAVIDVRISRCDGDGFIMRGPHDTIIRSAIIAICKGRGLAVEASSSYNGACDIEFCHAYATNDVAIDLSGKVKAGFLQGDTGRGAGVRILGSDKTYVDRIECFKTRGEASDFALDIRAPFTQVGLARVRADWGSGGVRIGAQGCQIGQLDVDGRRNTGGPLADTPNETTALSIEAAQTQIGSAYIRHFPKGKGIVVNAGLVGIRLAGITADCGRHLEALDAGVCDIRLDMQRQKDQDFVAEGGPQSIFELRDLNR